MRQALPAMLPKVAASQGLPFARPLFFFSGGLAGLRAELGPRHQVRVGGEAAHVHADFGDQFLRGGGASSGDLTQLRHLMGERGDRLGDCGV